MFCEYSNGAVDSTWLGRGALDRPGESQVEVGTGAQQVQRNLDLLLRGKSESFMLLSCILENV